MDKLSVLQQLKQVTGDLQAGTKTQGDALKKLERRLAEQIAQNSGFELSGTNLHASSTHIPAEATEHFSHLDDLFEEGERQSVAPALVFRRETSIRNNLLGNSVPEWGNGLAPSETSGPFFDKHGSEFYFDFFFGVHTVQVFISGLPYPVLLLPIRGLLIGRKNYQLTAGSVWIGFQFYCPQTRTFGLLHRIKN